MAKSAIDYIAESLNILYPGANQDWIEKAAKEMYMFDGQYDNPTQEQRMMIDERIRNMCMTGQW